MCHHIINFLESIHSYVMCANVEIASVIFEICIVREPATAPGPVSRLSLLELTLH